MHVVLVLSRFCNTNVFTQEVASVTALRRGQVGERVLSHPFPPPRAATLATQEAHLIIKSMIENVLEANVVAAQNTKKCIEHTE